MSSGAKPARKTITPTMEWPSNPSIAAILASATAAIYLSGQPFAQHYRKLTVVEKVADGLASEVSDVLGATVALEIGHILLGSKAHTRSGIMCSRFQRTHIGMAARGELRFAPEQARRMQATLGEQVLAKQSNR